MKLKGLIHDIILGISVFSLCLCYFLFGTPTQIKAFSIYSLAQSSLSKTFVYLKNNISTFNEADYKYFSVRVDKNKSNDDNYYIDVYIIPSNYSYTAVLKQNGTYQYENYTYKRKVYTTSLVYKISDNSLDFQSLPYLHESPVIKDSDNDNLWYNYISLSDGTLLNTTQSPNYCTFTYLTDHEKLSDLLVEINTTPEAKQTVTVSTDNGSAITCTDKSTNKVYTVGEYPIINGVPSFALGHSKCKDEQIPTDDNNYFFQKDVPTENNEEYHAVCEYDNQLVYEFKEGSTGGGIDPDDIPDYGIFTPLVELLKGLGYWFIELIKGMFEFLFSPSENFLSDKFNELYTSFGTKFPFIAQIKPISDSVINLFNNSSTSPPNLSLTLPDIFGGGEFTIIDLNLITEYRPLIHGIILFIFCTNYLFDLPRKVSSALGEDK